MVIASDDLSLPKGEISIIHFKTGPAVDHGLTLYLFYSDGSKDYYRDSASIIRTNVLQRRARFADGMLCRVHHVDFLRGK